MRRFALVVLALSLVACGPDKPANDPSNDDGLAEGPEVTPSSAAHAEVEEGVRKLEAGDTDGAKKALSAALEKSPGDATAHFYLGVVAEREGDASTAIKHYESALSREGGLESAAINLSALYLDKDDVAGAKRVLVTALRKNPRSAGLQTNLALALAQEGDVAGAKRAFTDAEALAPGDAQLLLLQGQWLTQWKEIDAAKEKLQAARKSAKGNLGVLASVGFEMKNAGAFAECVDTLNEAIGLKDAAELRVYRALCKLGLKDEAAALADLEQATKSEPNYAPAHFYLGGRYAEAQRWADAEKAFAKYLELAPKSELAKKAQERLEAVRAAKTAKPGKKAGKR